MNVNTNNPEGVAAPQIASESISDTFRLSNWPSWACRALRT